jgi:hypothetical protein
MTELPPTSGTNEVMPEVVRIPRTGGRTSHGYCKLIEKINSEIRTAFAFTGRFMMPGSLVPQSDIRPPGWPDPPLLLEYVPPEGRARGWRAHDQAAEHILWTWRGQTNEWAEIGRASAVGSDNTWVCVLKPLAIASLAPAREHRTLQDALDRIATVIDTEIVAVEDGQRLSLLSEVHDLFARRASFWPGSERSEIGQSVGKNIDIPTKPSVVEFSLLSLPYMRGRNTQWSGSNTPSGVGESRADTPSGVGESRVDLTVTQKKVVAINEKRLASGVALRVDYEPVVDLVLNERDRKGNLKQLLIASRMAALKMTPEQKKARAQKAAAARWDKVRSQSRKDATG